MSEVSQFSWFLIKVKNPPWFYPFQLCLPFGVIFIPCTRKFFWRSCSVWGFAVPEEFKAFTEEKPFTFLHNAHFLKKPFFNVSSTTLGERSRRNLFWNLSPESRINQALEGWLRIYHRGSLLWRSSKCASTFKIFTLLRIHIVIWCHACYKKHIESQNGLVWKWL